MLKRLVATGVLAAAALIPAATANATTTDASTTWHKGTVSSSQGLWFGDPFWGDWDCWDDFGWGGGFWGW